MADELSYLQREEVRKLIDEGIKRAKQETLWEIESREHKRFMRRSDLGAKIVLGLALAFLWTVIVLDIAKGR